MRGMLVHDGLSRVLGGPCLCTVLGDGISTCVCDWMGNEEFVLPVCSLTRMAVMMFQV